MSDIVERLRRTTLSAPDINGGRRQVPLNPDGPDAADEIARLRAERAELVEALEPFARTNTDENPGRWIAFGPNSKEVQAARAALSRARETGGQDG